MLELRLPSARRCQSTNLSFEDSPVANTTPPLCAYTLRIKSCQWPQSEWNQSLVDWSRLTKSVTVETAQIVYKQHT
jgi:hypothetical protein